MKYDTFLKFTGSLEENTKAISLQHCYLLTSWKGDKVFLMNGSKLRWIMKLSK